MATARSAWGIDLGNRALKAIKLVQSPTGLRVDDFEVIEHETILSNAGDNRESLLHSALLHFMQRHEVKNSPVAVGVSGQSSFARFIKLPPVETRKIPEIVRFEAIQQIPFPLDDVEWSYQLFQPSDSPDIEVGIFAMRKELVAKQIQYLTEMAMNVQAVQMMPLAVYNAMYHDERIHGTVMFMDSGAESTDLIIADGETVWLRTLNIGGNNFTESLAKAFKLNFSKAEELKRNAATSKYARQIFQAMRPVFADLVSEIQRSIGFYASVHRDARIKKIVALGSTFRLPGLQKYLQQNLQIDVERIDSFRAGAPADNKLAAAFSENVVSLAGAYGLAVQAMGEAKITSSLLPEKIRRAKMWQEKTKWFAAAAAAFVLGTGIMGARSFYDDWSYGNQKDVRDKIAKEYAECKRLSDEYRNKVESVGAEALDQVLAVRTLLDYRSLWRDIELDILMSLPQAGNEMSIAEIKTIPREQRTSIAVDSIKVLRTELDVTTLIDPSKVPDQQFMMESTGSGPATPTFTPSPGFEAERPAWLQDGGMGPGAAARPGFATGAPPVVGTSVGKRGFVLLITATTPAAHEPSAGVKVAQAWADRLAKLNASANYASKRQYYVGRVMVIKSATRPMLPMPTAVEGSPKPEDPNVDRETGENYSRDTQFVIKLVAVLDPPAPAETSGGPTAKAR